MDELLMNTKPYPQKLGGHFTWDEFRDGLGKARVDFSRRAATDPSKPSWRKRAGMSCSINKLQLDDVLDWKKTNGPEPPAAGLPSGATEFRVAESLTVVVDPNVLEGCVNWHLHWEKV
jgi:hypothetical protein